MRKCNALPYEGNEPYIFVSYSHRDNGMVYPVIEYLTRLGYRIWYDNGIHPGTEWPEVIAEHLNNCSAFLAFISSRSLSSHNCKNEFNFAIMENKPALSVILEKVELSMAIKMQMATIQGILRYEYSDYASYLDKFSEAGILEICKGNPNDNIVVTDEEVFAEDERVKKKPASFKWFEVEKSNRYSEMHSTDTQDDETLKSLQEESTVIRLDNEEDDDEVTIMQDDEDLTVTVPLAYVLIRDNTGEVIHINRDEFVVGRRSNKNPADYSVDDPVKMVSRNHMSFITKDDRLYIRDNGAKNNTYVNGEAIEKNILVELHVDDEVMMAYEEFVFKVSR